MKNTFCKAHFITGLQKSMQNSMESSWNSKEKVTAYELQTKRRNQPSCNLVYAIPSQIMTQTRLISDVETMDAKAGVLNFIKRNAK